SMFLKDLSDDPKYIQKEVWQKIRERTLACDFSAAPELEHDELGPSNFTLFGKSLPGTGVRLTVPDSAYYHGITVTNDFTMITIDTKAIALAQSLPPGNYYVRVTLKSNNREYKDIYFTIDPYELPNLAYASVKDSNYFEINFENGDTIWHDKYWHPFGSELSYDVLSDTLPINLNAAEKMWAGRLYPVNIMYAESWATMYSGIAVKISASTPNLIACDSMGTPISEVVLQAGTAQFYIKALGEVDNATLTASTSGSKNLAVNWLNINIAMPPVPQIETAYIFDRTGDGRADSIWIHFNKPLGGKSILNYATFTWGSDFNTPYKAKYVDGSPDAFIVAEGNGFSTAIFTGGKNEPYIGKLRINFDYLDDEGRVTVFPVDGPLTDKVGPVIVAAEVSYLSDGNTQLKLTYSEGILLDNKNIDLFRFHCIKNGITDSIVKPASEIREDGLNIWKLIFPKGSEMDVVPAVGDSVRFRPVSQVGMAKDLLSVPPHELNAWVRITGEQKITVTSPSVVELDKHSPTFDSTAAIVRSDSATVQKYIISEQPLTVEEVAAIYGTQGHYLGDLDMGKLVENEIAEIVKAVQSVPFYTDLEAEKNGLPGGSYTIEDVIAKVSSGEITIDKAKEKYGISDIIVDAYTNNLLTKDNLFHYEKGTDADVQAIVQAVADQTEIRYRTYYYTSLGQYVNEDLGSINCNDNVFTVDGSKNCLGSSGRLFLAWNMRSHDGRLAGTGVYIARIELKIRVNTKILLDRTRDFLWGVRRGKVNAMDFGL
ncbi:MAG: hypothetical protein HUK20_09190, partial [Fibrobacter sp.]|nr:hypothetical protein [Fibrobacter sp.]